ncbi:MAG: isoprenylcysteine carboxylmethyltransferase family protein [Spirochaetia bacterium]|nr:isoprenylcysteine carboxylmethyltransferase family protein [Spirochaetia bacterium]
MNIKIIIFILMSILFIYRSRKSLFNIYSHGFYRFFAFEVILILILLNSDFWLNNAFSPVQIISWILLTFSGILVIYGFFLLKKTGKPQKDIENTTQLVTTGIYKYLRHPLYASLLYLSWGAFLKNVSMLTIELISIITIFLWITSKTEEKENIKKFGSEYIEYMKKSKMFVPFVY